MRIGLDYGGVISFAPDGWADAIKSAKEKGHDIFIISHAQVGDDLKLRQDFAKRVGASDLSFADLQSGIHEHEIAHRKAKLCLDNLIDIFIDDDFFRVKAVAEQVPWIASFYIPQQCWQIGKNIVQNLGPA